MNILQITPGAGRMYCGNCVRDNALVAELRRLGHEALMVPLYLPLTLDEQDQSRGTPVFFGGVNVYLDQQWGWYRRWAPHWLRQWMGAPRLLRWASGRAAKTRAADVGELTVSMLRGETGNQARDLEELVGWLKGQARVDVVCLSNAMLLGLAQSLGRELDAPVICTLQGEDSFLDGLPPPQRDVAWEVLREQACAVDRFIAPSRYFAELMIRRMQLPPEKVRVVPNGISLAGFPSAPLPRPSSPPVVGYFARMCADKGLDILVDAFIALRRRGRVGEARLRIGGGCGPADEPLVRQLTDRLSRAGWGGAVEWVKNPDRAAKIALLRSLSLFSVPSRYGEAFGLYVVEALAAGVPVVLPRSAAFPELIELTGGGVLCEPENPLSLAEALERLILNEDRRRALAVAGHAVAHRDYGVGSMAANMLEVFRETREERALQPAGGSA
jgi:glycosyltransferase involved in cell wall biosynthesis